MRTLAIGLEGNLNGETLTIVSFNNQVFKCDNGKTYLIAKSLWMTNPDKQTEIKNIIANEKEEQKLRARKASLPVRDLTEEEEERVAYIYKTGNDIKTSMKKATENYRNGRAGLSSLTK